MSTTNAAVARTDVPDTAGLRVEAQGWAERARALAVTDAEQFEFASSMVLGIKALRERIAATFEPMREATRRAWQKVIEQHKAIEQPLIDADAILAPKITAFIARQEQERREREAALTAAQQETDRREREAEAVALAAAGEHEAAAAVREAPAITQPVVVPSDVPQAGVGSRVTWKAEVTDLRALCRAIAEGTVPVDAVQPNMPVLHAAARGLRTAFNWPGVRAYQERGLVRRG